MQRRSFIHSLAWLTGGLLAGCSKKLALGGHDSERIIKGTIRTGEKGIANVVVSDGFSVVLSDTKGRYSIPVHPTAKHIFISTPAGYAFPHIDGIASAFKRLESATNFDFELQPLTIDDQKHSFIIWADPQTKTDKDYQRLLLETVPDMQALLREASYPLVHGITVGDIVWDNPAHYAKYNEAVKIFNIPFFQVLGNHDMVYNKGGDEVSDDEFERQYGPPYYSFNRGKVHYVVLDDVRYLGKDREYDGYINQQQLDWLKKDLSYVPKDHLLIINVHIPVYRSVKNRQDFYALLEGYKVHIMSGHTHANSNNISSDIYEHVHGTVSGALWTGPVCGDGCPSGYGVYEVDGTSITWYYKAAGRSRMEQMSLQVIDTNGTKELLANVWNWDKDWKIEWWADNKAQGLLKQSPGFDPMTVQLYEGDKLPVGRVFVDPKKTDHLFKATIPVDSKQLMVKATDRFGVVYESTITI